MQKLSADWIFPVSKPPVRDAVLIVDDNGTILDIRHRSEFDDTEIDYYQGCLVPGFVNVHCHLELSHMKGKVPSGTGLIPFITSVVTLRDADREVILDAIARAEDEMISNGIVAVGDISNTTDTVARKAKGRLRYYSFVEMFDFLQDQEAHEHYDRYNAVYEELELPEGHNKMRVPHAPYSVSPALFDLLRKAHENDPGTISMHNQEMVHENRLFTENAGDLIAFYREFGISMDHFMATGETAIFYALQHLDRNKNWLFIHNTLTTGEEIYAAQALNPDMFWGTCPNANLYIENRLPDYKVFLEYGAKMCIGTDSLTSNWSLSILDEMQTILRYNSYLEFEEVLRWATLNGAESLGFDAELGSFEQGKRPGVNLLDYDPGKDEHGKQMAIRKIV